MLGESADATSRDTCSINLIEQIHISEMTGLSAEMLKVDDLLCF